MASTNIVASNGIIHMIDGLLIPPSILPIMPHRCDVIESRITTVSRLPKRRTITLAESGVGDKTFLLACIQVLAMVKSSVSQTWTCPASIGLQSRNGLQNRMHNRSMNLFSLLALKLKKVWEAPVNSDILRLFPWATGPK